MHDKAILVDEKNNQYHFRVDGHSVHIYADCYESAVKKLKKIFPNVTEIS